MHIQMNFSNLLTILSSILSTSKLIEKGFECNLLSIILPSFICSFVPPLIANCAYHRYDISVESVILKFIGIFLGLYLHSSRIFLKLIGDLPLINTIMSHLDLIKSNDSTKEIIFWIVINEMVSSFIKKTLFRKKMRMRRSELLNLFLRTYSLYLVRTYHFNKIILVISVLFIPITGRMKEIVFKKKNIIKIKAATIDKKSLKQKLNK